MMSRTRPSRPPLQKEIHLASVGGPASESISVGRTITYISSRGTALGRGLISPARFKTDPFLAPLLPIVTRSDTPRAAPYIRSTAGRTPIYTTSGGVERRTIPQGFIPHD